MKAIPELYSSFSVRSMVVVVDGCWTTTFWRQKNQNYMQ